MDVGSAVTPKTCDQVLMVRADEAGVASHDGAGEASTSRLSDAVSHERPVIASQTAEGAHFCHISGSGPRSDRSYFGWVTLDATT